MSKSSGEFLTVSVLEKQGYDPLAYRFFCLLSHYRKTLEFSYEALDNAVSAYDKLICKIATLEKEGTVDNAVFDQFIAQFAEAMDNDLNTSLAITAIYDVLKSDANGATKRALLAKFDTVLSLGLLEAAEKRAASQAPCDLGADADILAQIELRAAAKEAKNFAEADRIRDELKARGILLTDTPTGTTYTKS